MTTPTSSLNPKLLAQTAWNRGTLVFAKVESAGRGVEKKAAVRLGHLSESAKVPETLTRLGEATSELRSQALRVSSRASKAWQVLVTGESAYLADTEHNVE